MIFGKYVLFLQTNVKFEIMETTELNIGQKWDKEISDLLKKTLSGNKFLPTNEDLTYSDFLSNKMLIIAAIREGIPYSLYALVQDNAPFSEPDWAMFLGISTKSLHRYKLTGKQFKPLQSEKIIEIAEVTNIGLDVFGDIVKFKLWLFTPNFALGNLKPVELLTDSYGKELVISELTRINYGILV